MFARTIAFGSKLGSKIESSRIPKIIGWEEPQVAPKDQSVPSHSTIKRLFAHSGNHCSFPKCTNSLVEGTAVTGQICHITAARPDGPRYNANQTPTERHGYDNLLLQCPIHHKVIDDDPDSYTVERLMRMKADHEARAGTLPDAEASTGAALLISMNQSGGISAHTIGEVHFHISPELSPPARATPTHASIAAGMTFFSPGEELATGGYPSGQGFTFPVETFGYLRLIPQSNRPRIGLSRVLDVFKLAKVHPMSADAWAAATEHNRYGAIRYNLATPDSIEALTQGFPSGELWGMNTKLVQAHRGSPSIPAIALERLYVATLHNYVKIASSEFGLGTPYQIEFGAKGILGAYVAFPRGFSQSGPIHVEAFRRTYTLGSDSRDEISTLLRQYFNDFYDDLVGCRRQDYFGADTIAAYELPPL